MAFLIKYWGDTANKVRKDMCFLKARLFTVKIHLLATPVPSAGATGQAGQADPHGHFTLSTWTEVVFRNP